MSKVSFTDYDPWGMILNGRSSNFGFADDKYKFTGKERDTETNYDYFGARYFDSRIGIWNVIDPLDSQRPGLSPYNYCQNNPLTLIDPTGMLDTKYVDEEGNPLAETDDGNDATVTVSNSQEFLDDYNNTSVLARDSKTQNSEWIKTFGTAISFEGGANVQDWALASVGVSALDFTSKMLEETFGHTTIRISSVKGSSPWIYNGWNGNQYTSTISAGKILKGAGMILGAYSIVQSTLNLKSDRSVKGWSELGLSIGSTITGAYGAVASLGYEIGKLHPLKLIGIDATRWFK